MKLSYLYIYVSLRKTTGQHSSLAFWTVDSEITKANSTALIIFFQPLFPSGFVPFQCGNLKGILNTELPYLRRLSLFIYQTDRNVKIA